MGAISESRSINQRVEIVVDVLKDMTRFPGWLPSQWGDLEPITQTLIGKGARSYLTIPALRLTIPSELEITEVTPERVRWAIAIPPLNLGLIFHLNPDGDATDLRLDASWHGTRLPPWRIRTQARLKLFQDQDVRAITKGILDGLVKEAESRIPAPSDLDDVDAAPPREDGFVNAGPAEDITPGTGRAVEAFGTTLAVFNIEGAFHAIDNDCPHREGPLAQGQLDGSVVTCPLHRWRFDVTDGACLDHPHHPTRAWPVKLEGGDVLVGPRA